MTGDKCLCHNNIIEDMGQGSSWSSQVLSYEYIAAKDTLGKQWQRNERRANLMVGRLRSKSLQGLADTFRRIRLHSHSQPL